MNNTIFLTLILAFSLLVKVQAQTVNMNGEYFVTENGSWKRYSVVNQANTTPDHNNNNNNNRFKLNQVTLDGNKSYVRWDLPDQYAIGYEVESDALGVNSVNGWYLNNMRISFYGNNNNTPLWEYPVLNNFANTYVSISKAGDKIAAGHYKNFYVFNSGSSIPVFNFDASSISPGYSANFVSLASYGEFLVAVSMASTSDSAIVYGFTPPSTVPVWQKKIMNNQPNDGIITGLKLSGNDSLFILSTFYKFYVMETYTGNVLFESKVGPNANSNTQEKQGINGDGSVISTNSHDGYLTVYKRSGNSYNMHWQHHNTDPTLISQWITVSDLTYDGKYIACGTLDWKWTNNEWTYDGRVKFFEVDLGGVPKWEYKHMGDMVTSVSFSKSGNILSASSWGSLADTGLDIVIFKSSVNTNTPIFKVNAPGSMLSCNTSENGATVMVTGKGVHARTFGNGGRLYNIFVDTSDNPIGIINVGNNIPKNFELYQNYPNPFNPVTNIKLSIPKAGFVKLTIYDVLGKEVQTLVNEQLSPGTYNADFDASSLPSGVYYYKIIAESYTETKKMVLIK